MSVASWFLDFCSNLQVQNNGDISSRYRAITTRLNTDFWGTTSDTAHSLYAGSYGRNTAIINFSDVDMIFDLPSHLYSQYKSYTHNGPSALLQAIKNSLLKTYSRSAIRGDGQVIVIPFSDGMVVEMVPAFSASDGSFTYPDANGGGSWPTTNPRAEISAIRARNDMYGGNLIRLCRMARAWKRTWDINIGGLLIDTLAYQFIADWSYREKSYMYYDYMSRDFFEFLSEQESAKTYWRAPGSAQYVWMKDDFRFKARKCYRLSQDAIAFEHADPKLEWSAKQKWREIYGTTFPN